MIASIEELAIIVEGLRTRVKQLAGSLGAAAGYKVANNLTTTSTGYLLDARQGKALKTSVDNLAIESGDYGITFFGAGYITSDKKQVIVTIPINKVIGDKTPSAVTLTEINLMQGGNVLYKTADGMDAIEVVPSTAANALRCGVRVDIYRNSEGSHVAINSNAVNNDAVGIFLRGTITFA